MAQYIEGENKIDYYAQELKENTYNLTRMNLVCLLYTSDPGRGECGGEHESAIWPGESIYTYDRHQGPE